MLQALNLYLLSKGRISYLLLLTVYTLYGIIELWLAVRDPYQWSMAMFVLLDLWGVSMAVKGWRQRGRLRSSPPEA